MPRSKPELGDNVRLVANPEILKPLRNAIIHKPPYVSGTLCISSDNFLIYYGQASEDGHARRVDLTKASTQDMDDLVKACQPAGFGLNHENVYDENYRKAGKMDTDAFMTSISSKEIIVELYKLNGRGPSSRLIRTPPRSTTMFGSLVLVFPTPHEGGALIFRHRGEEWTVDSAQLLAAEDTPSIAFIAFFSDVEHEVSVVDSGHRATLTYNLYFGNADVHPRSPSASLSSLPNELVFKTAFETLLADPAFLPEGGSLGFGLRHVYPGSDAVVWRVCQELGVASSLFLVYKDDDNGSVYMLDQPPEEGYPSETLTEHLEFQRKLICLDRGYYRSRSGDEDAVEHVNWVTDLTELTQHESAVLWYGNEASIGHVYGKACIVVRVGKPGQRSVTA
ncbi:hypothetical protein BV25DRAFT_1872847 [Artomyces pyxidatus]|uniref:Uncharacterized protein n=1 Tax=Artomyces pyxidatus TaxID=48021 RepID=A0ACB8SIB8_9AGAM|nr:hypothetical protein BV25DRAFT_1872847 [Artomyces pyxidatus]